MFNKPIHVHVHIHNDGNMEEIKKMFAEILEKLEDKDEPLRQEIMDKLNKAIADIASTI